MASVALSIGQINALSKDQLLAYIKDKSWIFIFNGELNNKDFVTDVNNMNRLLSSLMTKYPSITTVQVMTKNGDMPMTRSDAFAKTQDLLAKIRTYNPNSWTNSPYLKYAALAGVVIIGSVAIFKIIKGRKVRNG